MQHSVTSADQLGEIIRATRKAQGLRQDDAAGSIGVSENFLGKVERGNDRVLWGKLFQVLDGLGIRVIVDTPASPEESASIIRSNVERASDGGLKSRRQQE